MILRLKKHAQVLIVALILFFINAQSVQAAIYSVTSHEASSIYRSDKILNDFQLTQNGTYQFAVEQSASGNYYILEPENSRVLYFDQNFEYLGTFGSQGVGDGQFIGVPTDLEVDDLNNIYVLDPVGYRMVIFDEDGLHIRTDDLKNNLNAFYGVDPQFDLLADSYYVSSSDQGEFYVYSLDGVLRSSGAPTGFLGGQYVDNSITHYIKATFDTTLNTTVVYVLIEDQGIYSVVSFVYDESTDMYYYSPDEWDPLPWFDTDSKICSILPKDDEFYVLIGDSSCNGTIIKYQISYDVGNQYPHSVAAVGDWEPDGITLAISNLSINNQDNFLLFTSYSVPEAGYYPKLSTYSTLGKFVSMQGWDGVSNGQFSSIYDLLVQNNNLLVYSYNSLENYIVQKFDSSGAFVSKAIPFSAVGRSLNANSDGDMFMAGTLALKLSSDFSSQLSSFDNINNATDLAIDTLGRIIITDNGPDFKIFSSAGSLLYTSPNTGGDLIAVSTDQDNYIYIAKYGSVAKYNSNGSLVSGWSITTSGNSFVDITTYQNLLFATKSDDTISVYSLVDGSLSTTFGSTGSAPGQYNTIGSITVDSVGNIYVIDQGNYRVQKTNVYYQVENVEPGLDVLEVNSQVNVEGGSGHGISPASTRLQIRNSAGLVITEVLVNPNIDIDFTSVEAESDVLSGKSYVSNLSNIDGVDNSHDLYVPIPTNMSSDLVVVCPSAMTLSEVSQSCSGAINLYSGIENNSLGYAIVANPVTIDSLNYWKIEGLRGTGAVATTTQSIAQVSSNSQGQSTSSSSDNGSGECKSAKPQGKLNLFQIDVKGTDATAHFAPLSDRSVDNYLISYSTRSGELEHSVFFDQGWSGGVIRYDIHLLNPSTTYYFKIRPYNGCVEGEWSNELMIKTSISTSKLSTKYYYSSKPTIKQNILKKINSIQTKIFAPLTEPQPTNQIKVKTDVKPTTDAVTPPRTTLWTRVLQFFGL